MRSRMFSKLASKLAGHAGYQSRGPASKKRLDALEKTLGLPLGTQHRALLEQSDGWGSLRSYEVLGVTQIRSWASVGRKDAANGARWLPGWVPFAADSAGNLLCVESSRNRVVIVERQEGFSAKISKKTLDQWLAAVLDDLESGALVVDDEGFVTEPTTEPTVDPDQATELPRIEYEEATAIEAAMDRGNLARLARLTARTGLNAETWTDATLLAIAAEKRRLDVVTWMLDHGAEVDLGKAQGKRTALFWAAWGNDPSLPLARLLLARGADPNAMTSYDGTPLHSAAMWDATEVIPLLLAHGADPQRKDAKGKTPAQIASKSATRKLLR